MPELTAVAVEKILVDCLFKDEEMPDPGKPPEGAILVRGVINNYGLHPGRVANHKVEIVGLLDELDSSFHAPGPSHPAGGGGMSFLNACVDKNGRQWGEHRNIEQLYVLGAAIGAASFPLPREMWGVMPGGMPYIAIDTSKATV